MASFRFFIHILSIPSSSDPETNRFSPYPMPALRGYAWQDAFPSSYCRTDPPDGAIAFDVVGHEKIATKRQPTDNKNKTAVFGNPFLVFDGPPLCISVSFTVFLLKVYHNP